MITPLTLLALLAACRSKEDEGRQPIPVDERPPLDEGGDEDPGPDEEGGGDPPEDTGDAGEETGGGGDPPEDTGDAGGGGEGEDSAAGSGSGGSGGGTGLGSGSVGSTTYTWYVPACALGAAPAPVLFTQHGSGGTGSGMVAQWTSLADARCIIVVGQDSASGRSWNFDSDVTGLDAVVNDVAALWDVDLDRLYLHGYSAGAHWSYVIGLANSDVFAGLAVFAGSLSYAESYGVWPDGTRGPIPVFIAHGSDDSTVPYREAEHAYEELLAEGWTTELWTSAGGSHAYDPAHQDDALTFFGE